jgi:hypothetical protein
MKGGYVTSCEGTETNLDFHEASEKPQIIPKESLTLTHILKL